MKILLIMILPVVFPGCAFNVAWRGTLTYVEQKATTEGKVNSQPVAGDNSIAAREKQPIKADVPLTK